MKERPTSVAPKSSETGPPAANQPLDGGDLGPASNAKPGDQVEDQGTESEVRTPGKPDGEVDTRP